MHPCLCVITNKTYALHDNPKISKFIILTCLVILSAAKYPQIWSANYTFKAWIFYLKFKVCLKFFGFFCCDYTLQPVGSPFYKRLKMIKTSYHRKMTKSAVIVLQNAFYLSLRASKASVAIQKVKITLNLWIATNLHAHAL